MKDAAEPLILEGLGWQFVRGCQSLAASRLRLHRGSSPVHALVLVVGDIVILRETGEFVVIPVRAVAAIRAAIRVVVAAIRAAVRVVATIRAVVGIRAARIVVAAIRVVGAAGVIAAA